MSGLVKGAGTALQVAGQVQESRSNRRSAKRNSDALGAEARSVLKQSKAQADLFRRNAEVIIGDQVSSFAKGGVDISGSPLLVIANTKQNISEEAAAIEINGRIEYERLVTQARRLRESGRRAGRTDPLRTIGTLASGAGDFIGKMEDAKNTST